MPRRFFRGRELGQVPSPDWTKVRRASSSAITTAALRAEYRAAMLTPGCITCCRDQPVEPTSRQIL
jgi:hypothetical protein